MSLKTVIIEKTIESNVVFHIRTPVAQKFLSLLLWLFKCDLIGLLLSCQIFSNTTYHVE